MQSTREKVGSAAAAAAASKKYMNPSDQQDPLFNFYHLFAVIAAGSASEMSTLWTNKSEIIIFKANYNST